MDVRTQIINNVLGALVGIEMRYWIGLRMHCIFS